ncbi:hypothetical protein MIND_01226800 [Mycena indigotica]|uniref:Uncharacterized protein n=1 Tax=Mycena indigotica TaxID=2126181 RepID=A0A8H6S3E3_9AGAR|nr:uncharacterized protein MIND_01226800 [Mycena indigotica]KAF7292011.1 hypothetical protein MIND_01226800 [Mycena indigotica]
MRLSRSLFTVVAALGLPGIASAAVTPVVEDWKIALGWNQTILPASSFGKSVGSFTPPAGFESAPAALATTNNLAVSSAIGKPGGTFICQDTIWGGVCGYAVQPLNECILLESPWLKTISSFGPDPGATCFAFASGDCNSGNAQWSFTFPGDDTGGLATTTPWNDKLTSFACVASQSVA